MQHPHGTVLSTEHVDLVRGGRYLLRDITISIEPGQHWALLGTNGAGKSTLLSLFGATEHPTRGSVFVLGHKLGRVDMRELRMDIGHVNPRHTIGIPITVRNVVITGLTNTTEIMPRWSPTPEQLAHADALIDLLGMSKLSDALWPNLSQGERGRTLIARALMVEPRLLLLDEPATGLDLAAREQLLTALDDLRNQNPALASILVTHHIEEIPSTTTHALLIKDGIITANGLADDVITTENISECFSHPIEIERRNRRWNARSRPRELI